MTLPAAVPRSAFGVRQFAASDIPQVARLHAKVWPSATFTTDIYEEYFRRVYIENPDRDESLPSLVSEDDRGAIVGFIGVVPRRIVVGQRAYRGAVSSQFIVDPGGQAAFVAVRLLRTYLEGPQDVSIADEATDAARALWTGLGGSTAHLLSMYWTRLLRPARAAASFLRARRRWALVGRAAAPWAAAADALLACVPGTPFHQRGSLLSREEVSAETLIASLAEICHPSALRVDHDTRSLQWLLERVARVSVNRDPVTAVVTRGGGMIGWYVAALESGGECEVLQLVARPTSTREVLEQLFDHACLRGAHAVTGRMDPRFVEALSDACCLFHRRGPWMLVRTACLDILRAFESGHACFSRIDGEWPLRLSVPPMNGGRS